MTGAENRNGCGKCENNGEAECVVCHCDVFGRCRGSSYGWFVEERLIFCSGLCLIWALSFVGVVTQME